MLKTITINGKPYPLHMSMLAAMRIEQAFDGDINEMTRQMQSGKNLIKNTIKLLYIIINATAEELKDKSLIVPSQEWLALNLKPNDINGAQGVLSAVFEDGTRTETNEEEREQDFFLAEDRREAALKNA